MNSLDVEEVVRYWDELYKNFDPYRKVDGDLYLSDENPGLCKKDILIVGHGSETQKVRLTL